MVRNDRWIKEMARKGMIEPFEEKLVREGVISYGVSSYGYDMRVADEFKIFTNINSTVVDPKNFDPRSFVEFKGNVCIIPPNSFALARSVEYFRIPRDVLVICIGKSTYARCGIIVNVTPLEPCYDKETEILTKEGWKKFEDLRGDEEVATLNKEGILEYQRIEKMQKFKFKGEMIHIKGRNIDLMVTPAHLMYVRNRYKKHFEFIPAEKIYGKYNYELKRDCIWLAPDKEYFELPPISLDDIEKRGAEIRNAILSRLNGEYVETKTLYEACQLNISKRTFLYHLYKLAEEGFVEKSNTRKLIGGHSIKVCEWKKTKHEPVSLVLPALRIKMDDWLRFFGLWLAEGSAYKSRKGNYVVKIACFGENKKIVKQWLSKLPFHFIETDRGFTILNKQLALYLMQFGKSWEKFIPQEIKELSSRQLKIFLEAFMFGDGNKETQTFTTSSKKLADDLQEIIFKAGWASIVRKIPKEKFEEKLIQKHIVKSRHDIYKIRISKKHLTPKIYKNSFSKVEYDDYVYDVTVPNHTLYVRRNGKACWSSNCWEGYLTIEISNTTPLPAKIYANEGIAQLIFLKAEEECEVSYADRKGKYQAQQGIVLPKI